MPRESVSEELEPLLREVYDDDDFVDAILGEAGGDENLGVIADFIDHANSAGDEVSSDDLMMLALYLSENGPIRKP